MGGTGQIARAQGHALTSAPLPVASLWWRPPAVAAMVLLLAGCGGDESVRISQDRLIAAIEHGTPPAIIDVRTGGEYEKGHVPSAVHIPFYSLWSRAGVAKFALWTMGYHHVVYLEGHMSKWKDRGLPMNTGRLP